MRGGIELHRYLLGTVAASLISVGAYAQERSFQILPQDLEGALKEFGIQSGQSVAFTHESTQGRRSAGVIGKHGNAEALQAILRGTDLSFKHVHGGFAIMPSAPPAARVIRTAAVAEVAAAEQQAPSAEPAGGDIVVTAQGRTESLQTVPLSVSVTSGETLEKAAIGSLDELSSHLSAVKITSAPAADLLNIRGIGSGLNPGFEQSVGTFVDGVYRGRARAMRASLFDIERVEVLKGPQTTFFGHNTIAGAFNITTRKPSHVFSYNVSARYGTYGQYAIEGGVTAPLTDTLSVRVAGRAYGQNGYVRNDLTGDDGPHQRDWIGRASALWEPTANFTSHLRVDRGRMRDRESNPVELVGCPPAGLAASGLCAGYLALNGGSVDDTLDRHRVGYPSRYEYDFVEVVWKNELRLGDHRLASTTGYFDHRVHIMSDMFPLAVPVIRNSPTLFTLSPNEKYRNFSQELRLISPDDQTVSYLVGVYYSEGRISNLGFNGYQFQPFGAFVAPLYTAADKIASRSMFRQKDDVKSVFAAATFNATDKLRLNGGLRYSVVRKRASRAYQTGAFVGSVFPTDATFVPGSPAQQAALFGRLRINPQDFIDPTRSDKKLMPSASVQYDVTADVMTYASFTRGFKAGGFSDSSIPNPFGPENVSAYELGLKGMFFDRRLRLNLAAFWNEFTDLQETSNVPLANGTSISFVANAGKARSRGVEANVSWQFDDRLRFQADLSYLEAKFTSFPDGPCTTIQTLTSQNCSQNLTGKRRPFAPTWSGSAGFSYEAPLAGGIVSFDPSMRFTSRYGQQVNNDPLLFQEGYVKIDARLAYGPDDKRWEVAVIGSNLTNKQTASFRYPISTSAGSIAALPEEGRAFTIQISLRR